MSASFFVRTARSAGRTGTLLAALLAVAAPAPEAIAAARPEAQPAHRPAAQQAQAPHSAPAKAGRAEQRRKAAAAAHPATRRAQPGRPQRPAAQAQPAGAARAPRQQAAAGPRKQTAAGPRKGAGGAAQDKAAGALPSGAGQTYRVVATGYTAGVESTGKRPGHPQYGITFSGIKVRRGKLSTIAADPKLFPIGTVLYIPGYGYGVVADTGSRIKGRKIDLYFPSTRQVFREWGKRTVEVRVIQKGKGKVTESMISDIRETLFRDEDEAVRG